MTNRTYHKRGELIHGYAPQDHPLYSTWAVMLARCENEHSPSYENYGARGIKVCERWHHFKNFAEDMGLKPHPDLTLERMDVNANYEPSNCCWETRSNQCVNRRKFKNNTSGVTGVEKTSYSWKASFRYENVDYNLGRFMSKVEAVEFRAKFIETFFLNGKDEAIKLLPEETVWLTSKTGERGIRQGKNGTFITRCTVEGERLLIGCFRTLQEAVVARRSFLNLADEVGLDAAKQTLPTDRPNSRSTTGARGISLKKDGYYHLRAYVKGVRKYIGRFKTLEEAVDARRSALKD